MRNLQMEVSAFLLYWE